MKRAYCSGCGGYVFLDATETCPAGHPRSNYRDVQEVEAQGKPITSRVAPPAPSAPLTVTYPQPSVTPGPAPLPVPRAKRKRRWVWVVVPVAVLGLLITACVGFAVFGRALLFPQRTSTVKAEAAYPPMLPIDVAYSAPTSGQKLWALATGGILDEAGDMRHDTLGGLDGPLASAVAKSKLSLGWGIKSKADLERTLGWIEGGGHRKTFDTLAAAVHQAKPDQLQALRARAANDEAARAQLATVTRTSQRLGSKSLVGWDYVRYICVIRWSYAAGYITEDEAWQRIMPAAVLLQRTFSSWRELGDNYLIGREFWSPQQTGQDGVAMRRAYVKLLTSPDSPWRQVPWDLDLATRKAAVPDYVGHYDRKGRAGDFMDLKADGTFAFLQDREKASGTYAVADGKLLLVVPNRGMATGTFAGGTVTDNDGEVWTKAKKP